MYYSAFTYGFQWSAYQVRWGRVAPGIVYGGGGDYWHRVKHAVREREEAERKLEANKHLEEQKRRELEKKEAELIAKRRLDIQAQWLVNEIGAINKEILLIQQQNILLLAMVAFWIQEEEDITILLLCMA